jgi:dienelactone hydrolase
LYKFRFMIVALALAAGLLVGVAGAWKYAATDRGVDPFDPALAQLAQGLDADPVLAGHAPAGALEDPAPGEFNSWQASTRALILSLGASAITPDREHAYRVITDRMLASGVRQQLIAFRTFDGSEIPAYLHLPASPDPVPGILVIPGHVKEGHSGIEQLANDSGSYQHAAARQLAEHGFVTLTPELRGFGYLGQPFATEHRLVAYSAILSGTSYKWITLRDLGHAMQVLRALEEVDAERIAVSGASLGGELAVQYSALDLAVDAVVFHSFGGQQGIKAPPAGDAADQPHYCHVLPDIDRLVAQEHWFWLLAPRPVLGVRGSSNNPFGADDHERYGEAWVQLGAEANFELRVAEGGHEYFVEPAIEFLARVFTPQSP